MMTGWRPTSPPEPSGSKRTTVRFDPEVWEVLRTQAFQTHRGISETLNELLRGPLGLESPQDNVKEMGDARA